MGPSGDKSSGERGVRVGECVPGANMTLEAWAAPCHRLPLVTEPRPGQRRQALQVHGDTQAQGPLRGQAPRPSNARLPSPRRTPVILAEVTYHIPHRYRCSPAGSGFPDSSCAVHNPEVPPRRDERHLETKTSKAKLFACFFG